MAHFQIIFADFVILDTMGFQKSDKVSNSNLSNMKLNEAVHYPK